MALAKKDSILPLLKALGNPVRLDILESLKSGECCVCNIFKRLHLRQNLVSHHLAVLRKNKLIIARKEGKWVRYSLNPARFIDLKIFAESCATGKKTGSKRKKSSLTC